MTNLIDILIQLIGYSIFLFGIWLLVNPLILPSVKRAIQFSRFRVAIKNNITKKPSNKFIEHIEMIIHVVLNNNYHGAAYTFLVLSISLFLVTFFLLVMRNQSLGVVFLFSLLLGLLPYTILRVRLIRIRIEGSYEAEGLIAELNNQYKICNLNMIEAIDKTLAQIKSFHYSQRALFRLSMSVKEYKTEQELDNIIREFVYSIDTEWATLLGINIKIAVSDGRDVRISLIDILEELKQIKEILEKDKRGNSESFSMIRFMVPAVYVLSIFVAINFFGFSLKKFIDYQFRTDLGLKFALVTFASMIINYIVFYLTRKPKYDF